MVVGLIMLAGLFLYLIISIMLIFFGASIAREQGKPGWKGGLFMALIMYLILFWDWIPMRATHQYLCMTQGGFTLNKTLDEWKQEHPGIAQTLIPNKEPGSISMENHRRYILNQRFAWDLHTSKRMFDIREQDERIVDLETGEVLAQYIDFDSKLNQHEPKSLRDFKFWMHVGSCESGDSQRTRPNKFEFNKFMYFVENQKEFEK